MATGEVSHQQPVHRTRPSASPNTIMFDRCELVISGGTFTQTTVLAPDCRPSLERKETTDSQLLRSLLSGRAGAQNIWQAVAADAMADSRYVESRLSYCTGTREDVLSEATAWIGKRAGPAPILWVWGGVGIGKSALMRELCHRHKTSKGPAVVSFFFQRNMSRLDSSRRVIPTLSCQLLDKFPQLEHYFEALIQHNPGTFTKNSEEQFQKLIFDPLSHTTSQALPSNRELVIILDGVDECTDKDDFLGFLLPKIASLDSSRIRVIISSRQSPRVAEEKLSSSGHQLVHSMNIDGPMATRGVEVFLEQNFKRIWTKKRTLLKGDPCPDEQQIKYFATYSRGQFAYATALTNHTERKGTVPTQILPMLCDPVRAVGAFEELDNLYTSVLVAGTKSLPRDDVRSILETIVTASPPQKRAEIAALSGVDEAVVQDVVEALPGLLLEATEDGPIEILYPSFADYLCNKKRAHAEYWVNEGETHKRLVNRGLASILPSLAAAPSSISASYSLQIQRYTGVSMSMRHHYKKATQTFGPEWFHQEASTLIGIHTASDRMTMGRLLSMLETFHSMIPPPSPVRQLVDTLCLRFAGSTTKSQGLIRSILGGVLVIAEPQPLQVMAEILYLPINDAKEVFRDIMPFFQDANLESPLKFAHPELEEFLKDRNHSAGVDLYMSTPEQHFKIVERIWRRLHDTAQFVVKPQDKSTSPPSCSSPAIAYMVSHLAHHVQSLENAASLRKLVSHTLFALAEMFSHPVSPNRLKPLLELLPIFPLLAQTLAPSDQGKLRKIFDRLAPFLLSSLNLAPAARNIISIVLAEQEPPSRADLEKAIGIRLDDCVLDRIQPLLRSKTNPGESEPRIYIVNQWMREFLLDQKRCKTPFDLSKQHGELVRRGVEIMSSLVQTRLFMADESKWPQESGEPLKVDPSLFYVLKDEEAGLVYPHPRLHHHYRFASSESLKDLEVLLRKLKRIFHAYCGAKIVPVSVFILVLSLIDFLQHRDDTPDPSVHPTPPSLQKTILGIQDLLHQVLNTSIPCDTPQAREQILKVFKRLPADLNLLTREGRTKWTERIGWERLATVTSGINDMAAKKKNK